MKPNDYSAWQHAVLDEVMAAIAASDELASILIFKGARILARLLPDAGRQSLDIDANYSREFLTSYRSRESQAAYLQQHFSAAIRRHFERGSPVRYALDGVIVKPSPPKDHPLGWNAFLVTLRVTDRSQPGVRGLPSLTIDVAHPEELTADSTALLQIDGRTVHAYTLHRIAAEKLRAFLQNLPEHQIKIGGNQGNPRAKDIYDLARILRFQSIQQSEFWEIVGAEFCAACTSRYVDCLGWPSFKPLEQLVRGIYQTETTIPSDVDFDTAWAALRQIVFRMSEHGMFPICSELPIRQP